MLELDTKLDFDLIFDKDEDNDGLLHGAHLECQLDSDVVKLVCGKVSGWHAFTDASSQPECNSCYGDNICCPNCGCRLVK